MFLKKRQRVACIGDFLETDHTAPLTFTLATLSHVKAESDVSHFLQHRRRVDFRFAMHVRAETMHNYESCTPLSRSEVIGQTNYASEG